MPRSRKRSVIKNVLSREDHHRKRAAEGVASTIEEISAQVKKEAAESLTKPREPVAPANNINEAEAAHVTEVAQPPVEAEGTEKPAVKRRPHRPLKRGPLTSDEYQAIVQEEVEILEEVCEVIDHNLDVTSKLKKPDTSNTD